MTVAHPCIHKRPVTEGVVHAASTDRLGEGMGFSKASGFRTLKRAEARAPGGGNNL